jgi:SAM-dependent methyltransferase
VTELGPELWGERVADVYDEWLAATPHETDRAVEVLAELAGEGPALELAIGSGRIALPLAARGVEVHGIDASQAMIDRLREQPGGDAIPAVVGNFADVGVEGLFSLVFVAFQTFHVLGSLAEQVRCFENVAAHLQEDGCFALETNVVPPELGARDGSITIWKVEPDRLMLGFERRGDELQAVTDVEVWLTEQSIRMIPMRYRYTSPVELDLMARLAGLRLRDRWGGWDRQPLGPKSTAVVSVYVKDRGATPIRKPQPLDSASSRESILPEAEQVERFLAEVAEGGPVLRLDAAPDPDPGDGWKVVFRADAFEGVESPEDQQAVFDRAAELLAPGGRFVVQAGMPQAWRFTGDSRIVVADADAERVVLDVARIDRRVQRVDGHEVELSERGVRLRPTSFRYALPTELDLMARIAGFRLAERWGGWGREPFTPDSPRHVSVYERAT